MKEPSAGYSAADEQRVRAALAGWPSWRCEFHPVLDSTQDECRRWAVRGSTEHLCVIASHQTRPRGSRGRAWHQAPHQDVAASVLITPDGRYPDLLLPFVLGAAVHRTVAGLTSASVRIKWPNDILAGGRKLGGILLEGGPPGRWIGGVGLNVNRTDFPPELAATATSLGLVEQTTLDRGVVLACLLAELARLLDAAENGRHEPAVDSFLDGTGLRDRLVRVETAAGTRRGRLHAITPEGVRLTDALLPLGEVRALSAG